MAAFWCLSDTDQGCIFRQDIWKTTKCPPIFVWYFTPRIHKGPRDGIAQRFASYSDYYFTDVTIHVFNIESIDVITHILRNAIVPRPVMVTQMYLEHRLLAILDLTPGFNGLGRDNCKTRRETFKCWNLVCLILKVWLWNAFYWPMRSYGVRRDKIL